MTLFLVNLNYVFHKNLKIIKAWLGSVFECSKLRKKLFFYIIFLLLMILTHSKKGLKLSIVYALSYVSYSIVNY